MLLEEFLGKRSAIYLKITGDLRQNPGQRPDFQRIVGWDCYLMRRAAVRGPEPEVATSLPDNFVSITV